MLENYSVDELKTLKQGLCCVDQSVQSFIYTVMELNYFFFPVHFVVTKKLLCFEVVSDAEFNALSNIKNFLFFIVVSSVLLLFDVCLHQACYKT